MSISTPRRPEIDYRTINLIVGLIAVSLAPITNWLAGGSLDSVSASYYAGDWPRSIFVGFLFAIASFLLAYNGKSVGEMISGRVAAGAALGVALFPCQCGNHLQIIDNVHSTSAAVMFLILAYFCYKFYKRARAKGWKQAKWRSYIYAVCGVAMLAAIVVLVLDHILSDQTKGKFPTLIFWGEATGLTAFGISWLTASRTIPGITRENERYSPLDDLSIS